MTDADTPTVICYANTIGGRSALSLPKVEPDAEHVQRSLLTWLELGGGVYWVPIYAVGDGPGAARRARAMQAKYGGRRLITAWLQFGDIPMGITGWVLPVGADDTDLIAVRIGGMDVNFGPLTDPQTLKRVTYKRRAAAGIAPL